MNKTGPGSDAIARKGRFIDPFAWLKRIVQSVIKPRHILAITDWIDRHVSIPVSVGSPNPGPMRTAQFPVYRGLYDLVSRPGVHFFSFAASARVGKTLMSICLVLHKIAERPGPILWLDPTAKSAKRFSQAELDPFMRECRPVWEKAIVSKFTWKTLEKSFRGCFLRLVGSGAEADLHGFQAEMLCLNESDRLRAVIDRDASSSDKAIARSKQFAHSRLIIRNSTPTEEFGDIWVHFKKGSQHHCYVRCPHCHARQRLTFFSETKDVPFDADGAPLPAGQVREETTGRVRFEQFATFVRTEVEPGVFENVKTGYDLEAVERGATYECANCKGDIESIDLNAMLAEADLEADRGWIAHNPRAPRDHVSAHLSALYSPFEVWGILAKKFLECRGSMAALRGFYNLDLGLPFIRYATQVKEDDLDRAARRCPNPYVKGILPLRPEVLTITVDVGGSGSGDFWWSVRAWGVLWDHPDRPTWSALIDWGPAVSWEQIEEIAGIRPLARRDRAAADEPDRFHEYRYRDPVSGEITGFRVTAGLVDSGFEAKEEKNVYEFCVRNSAIFSPSKGGGQQHLRGNTIRLSPVHHDALELVWYWDDWFKTALYYHAIKEGKVLWFLPTNIDDEYKRHLTSERTEPRAGGKLEWVRSGDNHIADTEKMHEVLRDTIETTLDQLRAAKEEEEAQR